MILDVQLYLPKLFRVERGEVSLYVDPGAPNWLAVNSHGARVLELCDGSRNAGEVVEELQEVYPHSKVREFIEGALKIGMIVKERPIVEPYSGRAAYLEPESLEELWMYVTNRCNLRCSHCLVSAGENPSDEMGEDEIKQVLKSAVALGAKRIFFTGGEPFLRKDLLALIEYVKQELKVELVILTNGTLLDNNLVKALAGYPGLVIQVSLEGATSDVNDSVRGRGSHVKAVRAIERLREQGVRTIVTSTAIRGNLKSIPKLNELLREKEVKTHHILWIHERGRAAKNPVAVENQELLGLMNILREGKTKVDNWESFKARVFGKRGVKVDGCHASYSSLSVDSNGDIYPCPSLNGEPEFYMGNIDEGLESVWRQSEVGNNFRETSVANIEECSSCDLRFFCGGGCRCQAYFGHEDKDLHGRDPYCEVIRAMLIESMMGFVNSNGQNNPEILGHMQDTPALCDCRTPSPGGVKPFHCTCVLDVESPTHAFTSKRYGGAAGYPEQELCCPTDYSEVDLQGLPKSTISLSYGCGNPAAFADLKRGESVLDIGSGGGIDCFVAAKKVGSEGRVIGVDMTDEMLGKANINRLKMKDLLGYDVVEFRKGLAEELPVENSTIDLVISNCVINLSPDKARVFEEIYRVLKKGGRFSISDIVSDAPVPEEMKQDEKLWSGCISGSLPREEFLGIIRKAGFKDVSIEKDQKWKEIDGIGFHSVTIKGKKSRA